jgi:hypothetical protein
MSQLDMFGAAPVDEGNLIGLKVKLDRPIDHERPCCRNLCIIGAGNEISCADCGQQRGRFSPATAQWIASIATRFGALTTPIVVRKAHTYEEEVPPTETSSR